MKVKDLKNLLKNTPDDFDVEICIGNFTDIEGIKTIEIIKENDIGWSDKVLSLEGKQKE